MLLTVWIRHVPFHDPVDVPDSVSTWLMVNGVVGAEAKFSVYLVGFVVRTAELMAGKAACVVIRSPATEYCKMAMM